ncbi:MAG: nitrogen fixation protein NifZ [Spongiibacteraceae bacterium]
MLPRFDYGDDVRVIRNVRNDGTFPGKEVGELLIRRGSVGNVHDVGTYLQDQIIYRVYFIEGGRMIGCREEELIPASDPWVDSIFEFRERVKTKVALSVGGEVVVPLGTVGTVLKILRDAPGGPQYHVHFNSGRMFQIPEPALELAPKNEIDTDEVEAVEMGDDEDD